MSIPNVYGVMLCATDSPGPNQNRSSFIEVSLPANHKVFSEKVTPISRKLDLPLLVHRLKTRTIGTTNPRACWLNIDPENLLAPMEWQDHVGNVVVVRADKKPLSIKDLTAFTDYVYEILSTSDPVHKEIGEPCDPRRYYKPGKFEEYMEDYPGSRNIDVDFSRV
ncbi:MAG: hypothetical protein HETSPECPRED_002665 [Heterodermia speciosa]|uniref:Uncharacterized protein n=1 Tax=Heterodermia speciosa TaxID=116794 RepID=A0A8H3J5D6_9LECA|nr:MAG: hypothetical protein HETSPECPRED_002665 [Heterodermia speciosa]